MPTCESVFARALSGALPSSLRRTEDSSNIYCIYVDASVS
jgi:hypothetical protein